MLYHVYAVYRISAGEMCNECSGVGQGARTSSFPYPDLPPAVHLSPDSSPFWCCSRPQVNEKASKPMLVSAIHYFVLFCFVFLMFLIFCSTDIGNNWTIGVIGLHNSYPRDCNSQLKVWFARVYLLGICSFCKKVTKGPPPSGRPDTHVTLIKKSCASGNFGFKLYLFRAV